MKSRTKCGNSVLVPLKMCHVSSRGGGPTKRYRRPTKRNRSKEEEEEEGAARTTCWLLLSALCTLQCVCLASRLEVC